MVEIKIKKLTDSAIIPEYKTSGSAGADLYVDLDSDSVVLDPGQTKIIPTNLSVELPEGYVMFVVPRSGISAKTTIRIANSPGTVDSDYRGNVGIICTNISANEPVQIKNHDRIAQMIIMQVPKVNICVCDNLTETERGSGGFGSTGV